MSNTNVKGNAVNSIAECKRCLLTEEIPGIQIDGSGLCSACRDHDLEWGDWDKTREKREAAFQRIIDDAKSKKRLYDVLVPVSGGKDSIYIMYLLKIKYKLNCLAVTWDNGFLSSNARDNIKNACEILGVDHMYYGISKPTLVKLYKSFLLETGFFCPVCMRGIDIAQNRAMIAFDIPLAVRGTSRRTEEHVSPEFFVAGNLDFVENVIENHNLKSEAQALVWPTKLIGKFNTVNMPDYIDWNYSEIFSILRDKLNWKEEKKDSEHSDCLVANIVDYIRRKKYPVLIPEMLRYSKLVTCGQLTRVEAEKKVNDSKKEPVEPGNLEWFLSEFNISKEEFDKAMENPLRHMKYLEPRGRLPRKLDAIKKLRVRAV